MNTALLELPYLPNAIWLRNFLEYEHILIEREENFVKSSFRNRCIIAGANGKLQLSIPIKGGRDHHQLYRDVQIDYTKQWQKNHWQSIRSAYGNSPFYMFYTDRFRSFYEKEYTFLFDFNYALLKTVLQVLKTDKPFGFTALYEKEPVEKIDLRHNSEIPLLSITRYCQPFEERTKFMPNMCALDLIFNLGPEAKSYLMKI